MGVTRAGEHVAPELVEAGEQAAEGEDQQEHDIDGQFDEGEASFGDGVVGGLLMVGKLDALGEFCGYGRAMGADMTQLAPRQPCAQGGGQGEHHQENEGEERSHGSGDGGNVPECKLTNCLECMRIIWHKIKPPWSGSTWK